MSRVAYTVIAETESPEAADAFSDWLTGGHIAEVIEAGAESATLVRSELEDARVHRFEVRYLFDSAEALSAYESGPALALRAEGIERFGPESKHPIRFTRMVGSVLQEQIRA